MRLRAIWKALTSCIPCLRRKNRSRQQTGNPGATEFEEDMMPLTFMPTVEKPPAFAAHFDDMDLVPVNFGQNGVTLLRQGTEEADETLRHPNAESSRKVCFGLLHKAQTWFFMELDDRSAVRVLNSNGLIEGTFLVTYTEKKHKLFYVQNKQVKCAPIKIEIGEDGEYEFSIDGQHRFPNISKLTTFYKTNRSDLLGKNFLTEGVGSRRRNLD